MAMQLFVSNIPFSCEETVFNDAIASVGRVTDAKLVINKITGKSKGYGFITVADKQTYDKFLSDETNIMVNGRRFKFVEYHEIPKFYKLHVGNIPESLSNNKLVDIFRVYGHVTAAIRDYNKYTNTYKNSAVVTFTDYDEFHDVLEKKNITAPDGTVMFVAKRRINKYHNFARNFGNGAEKQYTQTPVNVPKHKLQIQYHKPQNN